MMSLKQSIRLGELHKEAIQFLTGYSDSARLDAELIICHVLNISRSMLLTRDQTDIEINLAEKITDLLETRKQGHPIAYITGNRHFWDLELKIDKNVLIPRPETELLVETASTTMPHDQAIRVLDLGTGSGAIAIAIANSHKNWSVIATDISDTALEVAQRNASSYQLTNIEFVQSNWFDDIPQDGLFDIIVSNPPYIAENDPHLKQGDVRFEPKKALVSGRDGLDDIRQLLTAAQEYLKQDAWLWLEHGYNQGAQVQELFARNNYTNIKQHRDLSGHIRITGAQKT